MRLLSMLALAAALSTLGCAGDEAESPAPPPADDVGPGPEDTGPPSEDAGPLPEDAPAPVDPGPEDDPGPPVEDTPDPPDLVDAADVAPPACGGPAECDDGEVCTGDLCDPVAGCSNPPLPGPCEDGDACTIGDACAAGACAAGQALACDDASSCTQDSCDPTSGCIFAPASGACDDGDACTDNDLCKQGSCTPGPPKQCGDGEPCNGVESCDPAAGCVAGIPPPCDDGDVCNGVETCSPGFGCELGAKLECHDDNPCTLDGCDPGAGCTFTPHAGPCEDGDACTVADTCADSACVAGGPKACGDSDECTLDACQDGSCTHTTTDLEPVVTVTGVAAGGAYGGPVSFQVEVEGPAGDGTHVALDGLTIGDSAEVSEPGDHELVVTTTSCANLVETHTVVFTVDLAPPEVVATVTPEPNAAGWINLPAVVTFEATDNSDGSGVASLSEPVQVTASGTDILVEGSATDAAGNTATASVTLQVDLQSPVVTIDAPIPNLVGSDQMVVAGDTISFAGTLSDDAESGFLRGMLTSSKLEAQYPLLEPGPFEVEVPLKVGVNTIVVSVQDVAGNTGTASVCVIRDDEPPRVHISYPLDAAIATTETVTVTGLAQDLVVGSNTDEDVTVTVNGADADVVNGRFMVPVLALDLGENTLTAVATDAVGHTTSHTVHVTRMAPSAERLELATGDCQVATVHTDLPEPIVVRVVDTAGAPVADKQVLFAVTDNDGAVDADDADAKSPSGRELLLTTDADGLASALWTLGGRAGAGNNRVTVTAPGVVGSVSFHATGEPAGALNIHGHGGMIQTGTTNEPLPMPFSVIVTDATGNSVGGMPVTFTVTTGDGKFPGGQQVTVLSSAKGLADAIFTPGDDSGPASHRVVASMGNDGQGTSGTERGVTFTVSAYEPAAASLTAVSGVVLDQDETPLPGVSVRFPGASLEHVSVTDAQGRFLYSGAPAGYALLEVDGSTAVPVSGAWGYPKLMFETNNVEGVTQDLDRPIYMVRLNAGQWVDGTTDVRLTIAELPGFELLIPAGTKVLFPDGKTGGVVSLTRVNFDQAPMAPVNGLQSRALVTIQPPGVRFEPAAPLTIPNVDAHPAGGKVEMYSYDHDLEAFVPIGPGTVSDDGTRIESDPGVGVVKGGWHCGADPDDESECGNLTAELAIQKTGASATLRAEGDPDEDTHWQFCSSGSINVTSPTCEDQSVCVATATPKDGSAGFGRVKAVHIDSETGEMAQDVRLVTLCDTAPVKVKVPIPLEKPKFLTIDQFQEAHDKVAGWAKTLGCSTSSGVNAGLDVEFSLSCCLDCPGTKAIQGTVTPFFSAKWSVECQTPWGRNIPLYLGSIKAGLFGFFSLASKIGGSVDFNGCTWPPQIEPKVSGSIGAKFGGRVYLLAVDILGVTIVDIHGDVSTGFSAKASFSKAGLKGAGCWDGISTEISLSFVELAAVSVDYTFFCPQTIWGPKTLPFPEIPFPGNEGCKDGIEDPGDPPCGFPSGGGVPDGGSPDGSPGGNTGFSGGSCGGGACTYENGAKCVSHQECDDADICNGLEQCDPDKGCKPGTPLTCEEDSVACTSAACHPQTGCYQETDDTKCHDMISCTDDVCELEGCKFYVNHDNCDDNEACTIDTCTTDGSCQRAPVDAACTDGIACTLDTCVLDEGCKNEPQDAQCTDGVSCTNDLCKQGEGCVFEPDHTNCDDGAECSQDTCDGQSCQYAPSDAACDDGTDCTTDTCASWAGCSNQPQSGACDDGNGCTDDQCVSGSGCVSNPNSGACNDGAACTQDVCDPVLGCQSFGSDAACDDGVPCTLDLCSPGVGCVNIGVDSACPAGQDCTLGGCVAVSTDCVTTADCPGEGQRYCEAGTAKVAECIGGQCQSEEVDCPGGESGTFCAGDWVKAYQCAGAMSCTSNNQEHCGSGGETCAGGACGGAP